MEDRQYFKLGGLIKSTEFPPVLQNLINLSEGFLNNIYITDISNQGLPNLGKSSFSCTVVPKNDIAFKFPGTEIRFVLNPNVNQVDSTEFPLSASIDWGIIQLIADIGITDLSDISSLFTLVINSLGLSEYVVTSNTIRSLQSNNKQAFINHVNEYYTLSPQIEISWVNNDIEDINRIVDEVEEHPAFQLKPNGIIDVILEAFILSDYLSLSSLDKLDKVFLSEIN